VRTHPSASLTLVQEDEEETMRVLAESGVAEWVEIDEDGGKLFTVLVWLIPQVFTPGSRATGELWNSQILRADLAAFWRQWRRQSK
jgi:hypothetical protein